MAILNLDTIKKAGGTVGSPVKKTISWTNAEGEDYEFDMYVKPSSYARIAAIADPDLDNMERGAISIALSVCDDKGNQIFEVEDITGLDGRAPICGDLVLAILVAIGEVNEGVASKKKKAPEK